MTRWKPSEHLKSKICEGCNTTFYKDPHRYAGKVWERRRYCSTTCAYANRHREKHANWKNGGRFVHSGGYMATTLYPEHPLYVMAHHPSGRVLEHRLVMAQALGRPLRSDETVHHINGERADNRIENLQLRQGRHGNGARHRCGDCGSENIVTVTIG